METILEELDRRDREERSREFRAIRPEDPNPFGISSNDQLGFIMSEANERWAFGGNRACKTESAMQDMNMFCCGVHPVRSLHRKPPVRVRVCAPKWRDNIEDVIFVKLKEVLQRHKLRGGSWRKAYSEKQHKLYFANGSSVHFKSWEEDRDTYGGADLDAVYQDEHGPYDRYTENRARLTDRDGYLVATMTPEEGLTWEEDHVIEPPEEISVDYWFFDIRGNPYLDETGIRKFMALLKGKPHYDTKIKGQFCALAGLVIPQWNPAIHMVPDYHLPDHWPRVICGDFHIRKPSAIMWACWHPDGRLIVYRTAKKFKTVPEWKQYIRAKSMGEQIVLWLGDESEGEEGKNIYGSKSIIASLNDGDDRLPFVQVSKPAGSYKAGIYKLWEYLTVDPIHQKAKVQVFKSCDHKVENINGKPCGSLAWEMSKFQYKSEQKSDEETFREKVRKINDDYIDDLRHIVMAGPQGQTGQITSALAGKW